LRINMSVVVLAKPESPKVGLKVWQGQSAAPENAEQFSP
jgi:hypothetical protein